MGTKNPPSNYQILIKLLNGKHKALNFSSPILPIETLKHQIHSLTSIPPPLQLLTLSNSRILHDSHYIEFPGSRPFDNGDSYFPLVVHLLLRLRGGKGGFGSLLRGAATKAGQKKTNNFDACRDMSGRRLRHVNAEKKLEEWKAGAEERKLEKIAEDFLKKKEKELGKKRKSGKGEDAEKYVAKYREESAKCMEEVERTVRESLKGVLAAKRKGGNGLGGSEEAETKRMKIWLGKRLADSDSEDMDEDDNADDDDEENEKSVVIDHGSYSDSSKEADRSPDSLTSSKLDVVSSKKLTLDIGSEEYNVAVPEESSNSAPCGDGSEERTSHYGSDLCQDASVESDSILRENGIAKDSDSGLCHETASQPPSIAVSGDESSLAQGDPDFNCKAMSSEPEVLNLEKPFIIEDYNSAAEMEVLGLGRLKEELQARGLKCGGTLQERAARLFLLKTTPLEKLPKKLFAKK